MKSTYLPLLKIQRDFYEKPMSRDRFQEYMKTMLKENKSDLQLPLVAMNPMGKEHLSPYLERLIQMEIDERAAQITDEFSPEWHNLPGEFKISLIVVDDLKGGWTNRFLVDFNTRFRDGSYRKRRFAVANLWSSQEFTLEEALLQVRMTLNRLAYSQHFGEAKSLRQMMSQEGYAMCKSDVPPPEFEPDELEYIQEILAPLRELDSEPVLIPALFGDVAASQLGYTQLGLTPEAGLKLAHFEALHP